MTRWPSEIIPKCFYQEWFANRISEFTNELRKPIVNPIPATNGDEFSNERSVSIKDGTIKVLTNLALEFEDLANTCLLVLHLEVIDSLVAFMWVPVCTNVSLFQVRVQCFHYLKGNPLDKFNNSNSSKSGSMEPDVKVLKFTKVLSEMDEALMSTLHPRKTKVSALVESTQVYVFFAILIAKRALKFSNFSLDCFSTSSRD